MISEFIANNLSDIIGYAASICMVLGYMPQAIYTIRTHDTDGIALPTFLMMGLGGIFFAQELAPVHHQRYHYHFKRHCLRY